MELYHFFQTYNETLLLYGHINKYKHQTYFELLYTLPPNGPLHYEIASSYSELFDRSSADLLRVLATFDFYDIAYFQFIQCYHVGGVCTSQAAWEG